MSGAVDIGAVVLGLIGVYFGWAGLLVLWSPRRAQLPDISRPTLVLVATVLMVAYLSAAWATTGRTYGGHLLGLRVLDSRGNRLHFARAILRAIVCTAFPLGLLWAPISRSSRSVADLVCGTVVVYDWTTRAT